MTQENENKTKRPILVGPPWGCPLCHAKATRLVNYFDALTPPPIGTLLDAHGEFVWYLYGLPESCKNKKHTARMVKVGNTITPVNIELSDDSYDQEALYHEIEDAIKFLVEETRFEFGDKLTALLYKVATHEVGIAEARDKVLDILSSDVDMEEYDMGGQDER